MNGVPREVPRPKPEGPKAASVFGRGASRGTPFIMIPQGFSTHCHSFVIPYYYMEFISANGAPRVYHGEFTPSALTNIDSVKSNIVGRDIERMG